MLQNSVISKISVSSILLYTKASDILNSNNWAVGERSHSQVSENINRPCGLFWNFLASGLLKILCVLKLLFMFSVSHLWLQEGDSVYGDTISIARKINAGWKRGLSMWVKGGLAVSSPCGRGRVHLFTCQIKRKMKNRDGIALMENNWEGAGKTREKISRVKTLESNWNLVLILISFWYL